MDSLFLSAYNQRHKSWCHQHNYFNVNLRQKETDLWWRCWITMVLILSYMELQQLWISKTPCSHLQNSFPCTGEHPVENHAPLTRQSLNHGLFFQMPLTNPWKYRMHIFLYPGYSSTFQACTSSKAMYYIFTIFKLINGFDSFPWIHTSIGCTRFFQRSLT